MSLIEHFMEKCILMNEIRTSDGEGGFITTWEDGAEIEAAIVNNTSTLAKIAEKQGVSSTYKVTTHANVVLKFPDVIKRVTDGTTYRITSNGNDQTAPKVSTIQISQVDAERWDLPT